MFLFNTRGMFVSPNFQNLFKRSMQQVKNSFSILPSGYNSAVTWKNVKLWKSICCVYERELHETQIRRVWSPPQCWQFVCHSHLLISKHDIPSELGIVSYSLQNWSPTGESQVMTGMSDTGLSARAPQTPKLRSGRKCFITALCTQSHSRVFAASLMTQSNFLQPLERVDWIWLKSLHIPSKNGAHSGCKNNTSWNFELSGFAHVLGII